MPFNLLQEYFLFNKRNNHLHNNVLHILIIIKIKTKKYTFKKVYFNQLQGRSFL